MAFLTSLDSISLLKVLPKQMSLIKSFRTHRLSGFNFSTQTLNLSPTHRPLSTTRPSTTASANWLHQPNFIIDSLKLSAQKRKLYGVVCNESSSSEQGGEKKKVSVTNTIYARDQKQILGETAGVFRFDFGKHGSVQVPCPTDYAPEMCLSVIGGSGSGSFKGVEGTVELKQREPSKMSYKFDLKGIKDLPEEIMEGFLVKKRHF